MNNQNERGVKINEQYILKKDLPSIKAGEVFIVKDSINTDDLYMVAVNKVSFNFNEIENFDEWFALAKDKCEHCGIPFRKSAEYYECRLIDNMGLSVAKKICIPCWDIFIDSPCG